MNNLTSLKEREKERSEYYNSLKSNIFTRDEQLFFLEGILENTNPFNEKIKHLTFVGMSGLGKSKVTNEICSTFNLTSIEIDSLIGKKIQKKFLTSGFDVEFLGKWLGMPTDSKNNFGQKELELLSIENNVFGCEFKQQVLDTPGSAPYNSNFEKQIAKSFVVSITPTEKDLKKMFERYLEDPKPVYFDGLYNLDKTLKENYLDMVSTRLKLYEQVSNILLPYIESFGTGDEIVLNIYTLLSDTNEKINKNFYISL